MTRRVTGGRDLRSREAQPRRSPGACAPSCARCAHSLPVTGDGIRLAVCGGVTRRIRWLRALGGILLLLGGIPLALLVVPPLRVRSDAVQGQLASKLGVPVEIGGLTWSWRGGPELVFHDVRSALRAHLGTPIHFHVERAQLVGTELLALRPTLERPQDVARLELDGVGARAGRLSLRDGVLRLRNGGEGLEVEGHALGSHGGWVDVVGKLAPGTDPESGIRLYLARLGVPLLAGDASSASAAGLGVELDGMIALRGEGTAAEELAVDLRALGLRDGAAADWLKASLRGRVPRDAGRLRPGAGLRLLAELRELRGDHGLRVIHGPVRATLHLAGDTKQGQSELDADLHDLRIRIEDRFEKPAGVPARVRVVARWDPHASPRVESEVGLAGGRIHLTREAAQAETEGGWRIRTSWLPLPQVWERIPRLAALPPPAAGQVQLRARWEPSAGLVGEVVVRDVALGAPPDAIRIPRARVDLAPASLRIHEATLVVGSQRIGLEGKGSWPPPPAPLRFALHADADQIDVEALAPGLAPWLYALLGVELTPGFTWEDLVRPLVQALRDHPRWLERLEVRPARVRVRRLRTADVTLDDLDLDVALQDGLVRVHQRDAALPDAQEFALDLRGWIPRLDRVP